MIYQLNIIKKEPNPKYQEKQEFGYGNITGEPKYLTNISLDVEISDEQFQAIRKAVLEVF